MTEPIQTTRMRRLPTVFGVFTTFSDDIPDVKRFAQVNWLKSLTLEGKCLCRRAKPAHIGGHLPKEQSVGMVNTPGPWPISITQNSIWFFVIPEPVTHWENAG